MKIEIELEAVESLKKELTDKEQQSQKLEAELKALDTKTLKGQAVDLSKKLFDNYMECVFKHLGFTDNGGWHRGSVDFKDNLEHWLGKSWWDSERLEINIGANVSKQWRSAFLSLGIKPKSEMESE